MESNLYKVLKKAHGIAPTHEFKERSKRLILASHQNEPSILNRIIIELKENITFSLALTLTTFLLFAIVGGTAYFTNRTGEVASNGTELTAEAENLNFGIELGQARYFNESAEEITALLNEIKTPEKNTGSQEKRIIF